MSRRRPGEEARIDELVRAAGSVDDGAWIAAVSTPLPDRDEPWGVAVAEAAAPARSALAAPTTSGAPVAVSDTEVATPRRGRRASRRALAAAAVIALASLAAVQLTRDRGRSEPPERQVIAESPSTTSGTPDGSERILEHLPTAGDRSAALAEHLAGIDAIVAAEVPDGTRVRRVIQVNEVFPPGYLPALAPLPTRATWVFSNAIDKAGGRCTEYQPAPLTMDGFAGVALLGENTLVTVATYTFADEAEATEFFSGKSMLLGTTREECSADRRRPELRHRDVGLTTVPDAVDQWNSWTFTDRFLWLGESAASGILARVDERLVEIRVGLIDPAAVQPPAVTALLGRLLESAAA